MRFIQGTTTAFLLPSTGTSDYSRTLSIDQNKGVFKTAGTSTIVKYTPSTNPPTAQITTIANSADVAIGLTALAS